MDKRYTISFESKACLDAGLVGSKAVRLAEMAQFNFPIPKGFVVTVVTFEDFCKFHRLDLNKGSEAPKALARSLREFELPSNMERAVNDALDALNCPLLAVRSSSLAEDGMTYSMAGQFDTFLSVPKKEVILKIKECWASMYKDSVLAYDAQHGSTVPHRMGVIVQKQITPLYSGVLFTIDPLSKSTDHLVVEWIQGMGDRLVSGEATPERIYVSRQSLDIPDRDNLPEALKDGLPEILRSALKAERQFKHPADIEWCVDAKEGGFLVQARPVTGLTGDDVTLWTNVNMVENFPTVLAPFAWSIIDVFYKHYARHLLRLVGWSETKISASRHIIDNTTGIQAGRIYYNLSNWYELLSFFPVRSFFKTMLDDFIGQNVAYTFTPGSRNQWSSQGWRNPLGLLKFWFCLMRLWVMAGFNIRHYERRFFERRKLWRKIAYPRQKPERLLANLDDLLTGFVGRYYFNPGIVDILAALFPGMLKILVRRWLGGQEGPGDLLTLELMGGIELKSTDSSRMIGRMAESMGRQPELQDLLTKGQYMALESKLSHELRSLLDQFMEEFGSRCYHECMIVSPTFEERHDLFWELVKAYQESGKQDVVFRSSRIGTMGNALKALSFWRQFLFWFLLKNARRAIQLRERSRIIRSLLLGEVRHMALALGARLAGLGHIANPEDVFYLKWKEVEAVVFGKYQYPETIVDLVEQRKADERLNEAMEPPVCFITARSKSFRQSEMGPHASSASGKVKGLKGIPVSGGLVRGRVRVVFDPARQKTPSPGDILVAKATDPGWTPLFRIAGGLVLERGGMLSHGAIVAREFSIPAVAGVEGATSRLRDGEVVEVNGSTGVIRPLGIGDAS